MRLRLIAWLLTGKLRTWVTRSLATDLQQIAKYAPSAWENADTREQRKLYALLTGRDLHLKEWL
jgi:hypothetical protein